MAKANSPLRYPGGKACLTSLITNVLKANRLVRPHYVEPYAGGCGLALSLLYGGFVSDIHINDLDTSIWAFWKSVLDHTEDLVKLIETTPISIPEWHRQREIQIAGDTSDPVSLGFATFFLNRTNRSGIIKSAGVIGGLAQNGNYKMDCRFNRTELAHRIRRVRKYRTRIHLYNLDAIELMDQSETFLKHTFFYIDPPYFKKGSSLYTSFYDFAEHGEVADAIMRLEHPWILTYDNVDEIRNLYRNHRQFVFNINYSAQIKRVGTERLIASKGLRLTPEIKSHPTNRVA